MWSVSPSVSRLSDRPARHGTLPDVLFPTVNVRRKRRRSAVTNVRRAGSRPYFEWESELRWHSFPRNVRSVLLVGSIDCAGSPPSIAPLFVRRLTGIYSADNTVEFVLYDSVARHESTNSDLVICMTASYSTSRHRTSAGCCRLL